MKYARFLLVWIGFLSTLLSAGTLLAQEEVVEVDSAEYGISDLEVTEVSSWEPGIYIPESVEGRIGEEIRIPVEITEHPIRTGTLSYTATMERQNGDEVEIVPAYVNFQGGIPASIYRPYDSGDFAIQVNLKPDGGFRDYAGDIMVVATEPGEYTLRWDATLYSYFNPGGSVEFTGTTQVSVLDPEPWIYIPWRNESVVGDTLYMPVEINQGLMSSGTLTLNTSGVEHLDFRPAIGGMSIMSSEGAEGSLEVIVDFNNLNEPVTGLLGHIVVVAAETGAYTVDWEMTLLEDLIGGEIQILMLGQPGPYIGMPDTVITLGDTLFLPLYVTNVSIWGGYSRFVAGYEGDSSDPVLAGIRFLPAEGIHPDITSEEGVLMVSFISAQPTNGLVGHLEIVDQDVAEYRCYWETRLLIDLNETYLCQDTYATILVQPPFSVDIGSTEMVANQTTTLTISGEGTAFTVPSDLMNPEGFLNAEPGTGDREFNLSAANNLFALWPRGERKIDVNLAVVNQDNVRVWTTLTVVPLFGDANADGRLSIMDVTFLLSALNGKLLTEPSDYQMVCMDYNGDGRFTMVDAILTLRKSIGLPEYMGDSMVGKRLADDEITDEIIVNAQAALVELAENYDQGLVTEEVYEATRQLLYSIVGRDRLLTAVEGVESLPLSFNLKQNYPNPFNPSTTIQYSVSEAGYVSVLVYDALGQKVKDIASGYHNAGQYAVRWNANGISGGIYFCVMEAHGFRKTQKMILLK